MNKGTHSSAHDKLCVDIYNTYLAFQQADAIPLPHRKSAMGELLYAYPEAWRVVGITDAALQLVADTDFQTISSIGIVRAHVQKRADVYGKMLEQPLGFDEFMKAFLESDQCLLATKQENKTDNGLPATWHKIEPAMGMFQRRGYSAKFRPEVEGVFLCDLYTKAKKQDIAA